jgi:hypothetical protein
LAQTNFEGRYSVIDPALPQYGEWEFFASGPSGWIDAGDTLYVAALYTQFGADSLPYRNLLKFYPDGTLDSNFRHVEGFNPFFNAPSVSTQVYPYDSSRLLLNGSFDYIGDHFTPRLCRIYKDGRVDTTFSSALNLEIKGWPLHVDSVGRVLTYLEVGGPQALSDSVEIYRLMPDG